MREDGNGPHLESLKKTKNVGWRRVGEGGQGREGN